MEKWKDIFGYEGLYQVSNYGNIKSMQRLKMCGKNPEKGMYYKEKILKGNVDNFGYVRVNLWKNNKCAMVKVHKLVALNFISNHEGKLDINHINGVKTDNRVENLEWVTRSENLKHAYDIGLKVGAFIGKTGKSHHRSKQVIQMDLSGNVIAIFGSQREAERITGVLQTTISGVCNGKLATAGNFKWKFK